MASTETPPISNLTSDLDRRENVVALKPTLIVDGFETRCGMDQLKSLIKMSYIKYETHIDPEGQRDQ